MRLFETVSDLKEFLSREKQAGKSVGFVPTMGALHEGHLSLIDRSGKENDITVCSIFVNPIQFNDKNDLINYPRDKEGDVKMLESIRCDVLFYPSEHEVYPNDVKEAISLGRIENVLEGSFRPGHFSGVATVVKRLFEIVSPDNAYFGLKDYQQFMVIKTLVNTLNLPVTVIGCETRREADGLAMSSRNRRLSNKGRKTALFLYQSLLKAKKMISSATAREIEQLIREDFKKFDGCKLEYFEIVNAYSLENPQYQDNKQSLIACIAAYVEDVRLIDNLILIP
jgi:pantoate--beta-alanine ligase